MTPVFISVSTVPFKSVEEMHPIPRTPEQQEALHIKRCLRKHGLPVPNEVQRAASPGLMFEIEATVYSRYSK